MPYDESEIDHICNTCGKVVSGPHAGETATVGPKGVEPRYKGSPVSHTECEDCQMASENERQMVERHGPNWREKARAAGYWEQAQKKESERRVQRQAEDAASSHWWWRKMGKQE